ncbi:MAG TPA: hypothetical protein VHD36_05195 [Pirellulales bacterium]|nr:hypothetical protein [Pirellulales bacterium]
MATAGDTSNPQQPARQAPASEPERASPVYRWPRGMVWVALGVLLFSLIIVAWAIWQQGINARYAEIRARGEPVTFADLDAAYPRLAAGEDTTQLLLTAGNILNTSAGKPEWRPLPYIGEGPEARVDAAWSHLELAQKFLTENASALEQLHKAADLGCQARFDGVASPSGVDVVMNYATPLRSACRALCLEADVRQHSDDLPAAAQSLVAAIKLERALANEPLEVSQLIRAAIFGMAAHEAKWELALSSFSDADLRVLHHALSDIDFQRSLKTAFLGERVYTITGGVSAAGPGPKSIRNRLSDLAQRLETARCLDFWAEFIAATELPWPQMFDESRSIAARCYASQPRWQEWVDIWNPGVANMVVNAITRAELTRRLLLVTIALERYRLRRGASPADLVTLVPEFLADVPDDPTDGTPFSYQATDVGYVLYSKTKEFPLPYGEAYDAETGANPSVLFRRPPSSSRPMPGE